MNSVDLGAAPLWVLIPAGLISGSISLLVFLRFTDSRALRRTMNLILAHVLELRLFLDDPRLVFRAQTDLFRVNLRLLRMAALPCAVLAIPSYFLLAQLHAAFGYAALQVGTSVVMTARVEGDTPPPLTLRAPEWIAVETPAVRVPASREVSWRIRPLAPGSGGIAIAGAGPALEFRVSAGPGLRRPPAGHALAGSPLRGVEISYPTARVLGLDWPFWFFAATFAGAAFTIRLNIFKALAD